MKSALKKKNRSFYVTCLVLLFLVALGLRLGGVGYGLPYLSHPDESRVILDTLSMGHRLSLLPERPDYALLYRYLLLFIFGSYFLVAKLFGVFKSAADFALQFMIDPTNIYLIARCVSVIFGMLTGILAYFFARRIFKREEAGIAAFIFCLFEFQLLQHSQWAIYPVAFAFVSLPAFYFMFLLLGGYSLRYFLFAGIFCGLAISVQNQGIYLLPSFLLALILNYAEFKGKYKLSGWIKNWVLASIALGVFSLLGNFYWFFVFDKSMIKTMELAGVTRVGFSSVAPYSYNIFSMCWWFILELLRQDSLLGIVMLCGIIYAFYKHTKYDLLFLVFLFTYLWVISSWGFRIMHDMLALLPITCIFAARFIAKLGEGLLKKKYQYLLLSCLLILPAAGDSLKADIKKNRADTRELALKWFEENVPAGSKVAVDWPIFSVPVKSDVPQLFRNPIAARYFRERIDPELKERYNAYLKTQKTYVLDDIMLTTDEPVWPKDMPVELVDSIKNRIVYRDLYSRFNFKSLDELRQEKAQYIIISSFAWDYFLLDNDPDKTDFFNAFIKDNPRSYYRQAERFIDDNRHGPVFFLAKRAREFYEPLLRNQAGGIELMKEFSPSDNPGPRIKIFRVNYAR